MLGRTGNPDSWLWLGPFSCGVAFLPSDGHSHRLLKVLVFRTWESFDLLTCIGRESSSSGL